MEPRGHVQVHERKSDFARDFGAEAKIMPESLQVNAKCVGQICHPRVLQSVSQFFACQQKNVAN